MAAAAGRSSRGPGGIGVTDAGAEPGGRVRSAGTSAGKGMSTTSLAGRGSAGRDGTGGSTGTASTIGGAGARDCAAPVASDNA